jgi:putative tryptophan/tyrosine transport system substrate-binding protein
MRRYGDIGQWARCTIVALGLILGAASTGAAQHARPLPVVGWLFTRTPEDSPAQAFLKGMRELGYIDSQNIRFEVRWARGDNETLPALAAQLVALKPEVIVTNGEPAIRAVKNAAGAIPIVMAVVGDPVGAGLAASLTRPGGNLTGLSNLGAGLVGKRLELLHEAVPKSGCIAVLRNPEDQVLDPVYWNEITQAGQKLGSTLRPIPVRGASELDLGFAEIARQGCQALVEMPNAVFTAARTQIVELAARYRIAAIYDTREFVDAGGLMSYGPDLNDMYRRAAVYVDKILKGARPADLPIEQPTKFELVINLKTAKALDLAVPASLLARANEVME